VQPQPTQLTLPTADNPPPLPPQVGTQPRSVAVILLKWRREYYKSKEECCKEQGNIPGCDCGWGTYTYDNLPSPKSYSRLFTDECDKGPSLNRVGAAVPVCTAVVRSVVYCCYYQILTPSRDRHSQPSECCTGTVLLL
jgi:hypothetical protein